MLLSGGNLKGTGAISGPIDNISGDVAPGDSLGELTVTGNYTQGASGAMSILIAGAAAASQYDVLNLSGAAALGGTLNVTFDSSFTPYACEVFSFLATGGNDTGGNDTGQFATVNSNIPVQVNYFANGASITVLPEPSILATLCLGAGLLARRKKRLTTKR
jgi:hypothetical protein